MLPPPPPQVPRPSRSRVLLVLLAVVGVSAGVRLLLQLSSSFQDTCPATGGGALLDVSGDVTMHDSVFVVEDDNCLWDSLPGMYVEFDSREPAALAFGGPTRLGSSRNVGFELWAGGPIVAYSTDLAANRHACTIDVVDSTTERIAGSITCTRLVGARYSTASGLQRLRGANARAINVTGTFEFTESRGTIHS
jgi:hypothetical protein